MMIKKGEATILTLIALFGILTAIPLPVGGGFYVPFIVLFGLTGYLLIAHWRLLSRRDIVFLGGCFIVLTLNLLLSGLEGFQHQLKALLQLTAAFVLVVYVPKIFTALGRDRLRTVLYSTIGIVLTLAILERLGITRELSDSWRQMIFAGSGYTAPYTADARDLAMVGYVRPKVFAPEPAYLAGFLFLCLVCLGLVLKRLLEMVAIIATTLVAWFVIGSPVLLLAFAGLSFITLYRFHHHLIYVAPVALLFALVMIIRPPDAVVQTAETLEHRFVGLLKGDARMVEDASVRSRIYVPFAIGMPTALKHNPIWGVGIGGKEKLSAMVDPNYSEHASGVGSTEMTLGTNALGSMLATLGIVGAVLLSGLVIWYWWGAGAQILWLGLPLIFLFMFTRGAYETQSFWLAIFFMLGSAYLLQQPTQSQDKPESLSQ